MSLWRRLRFYWAFLRGLRLAVGVGTDGKGNTGLKLILAVRVMRVRVGGLIAMRLIMIVLMVVVFIFMIMLLFPVVMIVFMLMFMLM